ncbi:hypothetical protein ACVIHD_006432 [Bradyrhizobium embrapense]
MSNDLTEASQQDNVFVCDLHIAQNARLDLYLEDGARSLTLDVMFAPDRTVTCWRIRHEREPVTESIWRVLNEHANDD